MRLLGLEASPFHQLGAVCAVHLNVPRSRQTVNIVSCEPGSMLGFSKKLCVFLSRRLFNSQDFFHSGFCIDAILNFVKGTIISLWSHL